MLYAFCETYNIPFKRCGKLIVVHDDAEIPLETLRERGAANGVEGLDIVDAVHSRTRTSRQCARGAVLAALWNPRTEALVRTLARLCVDGDVAS